MFHPHPSDRLLEAQLSSESVRRLVHLTAANNRRRPHDSLTVWECIGRLIDVIYEQFHADTWTGGAGDWSGDWLAYRSAPDSEGLSSTDGQTEVTA